MYTRQILAALLLAAHVSVDSGTLHVATLVGGMLSAALSVLLSEDSSPPTKVATDVISAITEYLNTQEKK